MIRRTAVVMGTLAVFLVAGCSLFLGEQEAELGQLSVTSWAENFTQEDIDGLDENESVNAVLTVEPAINDESVFVTGERGVLEITEVPPGNYTIQPLHASGSYAKSVTVEPGQAATVDVPTPAAGIYSYVFNHAADTPPFSSADVRGAFNIAIDRSAIVAELAADPDLDFDSAPEPAYSYIPTSLQESDWSVTTIADADTTGANDLLSSQSAPFSFEVLYNDGDNPHGITADYVLADIEALNNVGGYTGQSVDFSDLISRYADGDFELIRFGWLLVSNNLYEYFAAITDDYWIKASYDSSELDTLLADMKSALDSGDLDTYEQRILAVNELLITDALGMPVYEY